ncbi:MAG: peptidoglycan DD-metalloendopeptidase family protein [Pseudomonadota bacterium]
MIIASAFSLLAAAPDTFTVDEVRALEAEKAAAQAELAALESAGTTVSTDLDTLERQMIAAAMESQRREEQATIAERRLIDLQTRLLSTRQSLIDDRASLEDLLGLLATQGRDTPPALIVSPDRANEAVRRAIVTGDAGPRLAEKVSALGTELDTLNRLERSIRRERAELEAAEAVLDLKQAEILRLSAAKRAAFENVAGDVARLRARVDTLAAQAGSLRDLLADLEATAPRVPGTKPSIRPRLAAVTPPPGTTPPQPIALPAPDPDMRPLGEAQLGGLARPVTGLVSVGFGDRLPGGGRSEGIYTQTRPEAQIVAPVDGRIEYAGRFRSYGEMLILRTSDDYHVILSGMGQIYGSVGQSVRAGEPIGQMMTRTEPPPELYMELRRGDGSMDPASWMKRGR